MHVVTDLIPHRPPFLFVDRVVEVGDDRLVAERTFRPDEAFYEGHYPGNPITPGVILSEACFQAAAVLLVLRLRAEGGDASAKTPVLVRVDEARFRRIVRPGETIRIEVELTGSQGNFQFLKATVRVEGRPAATLAFSLALIDGAGAQA